MGSKLGGRKAVAAGTPTATSCRTLRSFVAIKPCAVARPLCCRVSSFHVQPVYLRCCSNRCWENVWGNVVGRFLGTGGRTLAREQIL